VFRTKKQRQAFEKEALPHLDALYGMALRLTKNQGDAEDLVQDSLVKAYRFFHRYEAGSNIKAWLFKVMVNLYYNTCRKQKKDRRLLVEAEIDGHVDRYLSDTSRTGPRQEEILLDRLSVEKLRAAVEELPEEFRTALVLCDLHDFSYKEIADILNCPVGTVMSRLYRGRRILQKRLFDYAVEQGYIRTESPAESPGAEGVADLEAFRRRRGEGSVG